MIRFVISTAFLLGANAVGLLVAATVLDDMEVSVGSFVLAVIIFTVVSAVVRPFVMKMAMQHLEALMGGTALLATLIGLIVTSMLSDGFVIRGAGTWLLATVIVWLAAILAGVLLPVVFVKRRVQERRTDDGRTGDSRRPAL